MQIFGNPLIESELHPFRWIKIVIGFEKVSRVTGIAARHQLSLDVGQARVAKHHTVVGVPGFHGAIQVFWANGYRTDSWRPGTVHPVGRVVHNPCFTIAFTVAHIEPAEIVGQHVEFGTTHRVAAARVQTQFF